MEELFIIFLFSSIIGCFLSHTNQESDSNFIDHFGKFERSMGEKIVLNDGLHKMFVCLEHTKLLPFFTLLFRINLYSFIEFFVPIC